MNKRERDKSIGWPQQAYALFWLRDGVALTSRETETRPGTDPGTGFLSGSGRNRNGRATHLHK